MIRKLWDKVLDILFPRICISCRRYLGGGGRSPLLCRDCFESVPIFRVAFRTERGGQLLALGSYENDALRAAIHFLKYRSASSAMEPIDLWIKRYVGDLRIRDWLERDILIVPVPLHSARLRKRGFNQAQLIAEALSKELDLPIVTDGLKRIRHTEAQMEIRDGEKRKTNVKNCFTADKEKLAGRSVLLVDDVYTSGATVREAASALRRAGVKSINVFVLAKAN